MNLKTTARPYTKPGLVYGVVMDSDQKTHIEINTKPDKYYFKTISRVRGYV